MLEKEKDHIFHGNYNLLAYVRLTLARNPVKKERENKKKEKGRNEETFKFYSIWFF